MRRRRWALSWVLLIASILTGHANRWVALTLFLLGTAVFVYWAQWFIRGAQRDTTTSRR